MNPKSKSQIKNCAYLFTKADTHSFGFQNIELFQKMFRPFVGINAHEGQPENFVPSVSH